MSELFPDPPARRRPARPTAVPWTCDAGVPVGIREQARRLGGRACRVIGDQILVELGDGRNAWLNQRGEQTGRSPSGPVRIWDDVPWPLASVAERARAA